MMTHAEAIAILLADPFAPVRALLGGDPRIGGHSEEYRVFLVGGAPHHSHPTDPSRGPIALPADVEPYLAET